MHKERLSQDLLLATVRRRGKIGNSTRLFREGQLSGAQNSSSHFFRRCVTVFRPTARMAAVSGLIITHRRVTSRAMVPTLGDRSTVSTD
jgi:hypothetical protein